MGNGCKCEGECGCKCASYAIKLMGYGVLLTSRDWIKRVDEDTLARALNSFKHYALQHENQCVTPAQGTGKFIWNRKYTIPEGSKWFKSLMCQEDLEEDELKRMVIERDEIPECIQEIMGFIVDFDKDKSYCCCD